MPLPRITRKRQFVQGVLIAAALLLPFLTIAGKPFLRMDIATMTLFLAGMPLRIDQFYLVLLLMLLLVSVFLLMTSVLGRVWCGWLCPQTVFNDLLDLLGQKAKKKFSQRAVRLIEHFAALVIATLIAFNLFCWFMSPLQAATNLVHFSEHKLMCATFLLLTLCGYLNLMLVKRSFCRSYCPYGRFQTALMDAGTLNLSFLEELRERCIRCNSCVRTCPMGIDIRSGFQVECIGCGRCIDACRAVMEKKPDGVGLIDYRFGVVKGTRFRLGITTGVLLLVTLLLAVGLFWGVVNRSQSAFAVRRVATAAPRLLPDGSVAEPWRATIGNRSETTKVYSLRVAADSAGGVELLGQTRDISVAPNQHREVTFMIRLAKEFPPAGKVHLELFDGDHAAAAVAVSP
ncbi:MAG: 4Fe-4S binding protein [Desulfuromonadaceae bacterium]|nr:4Fe-4S binding protein [Desulfuromonadaceae bacterium]MDD2849141.1 4Fe-4S binding protein [Desulfuromonadaceae bacterium]MDD4129509.1 4Fe-4S binding protein [Desulfuromonadaceae bacterium]